MRSVPFILSFCIFQIVSYTIYVFQGTVAYYLLLDNRFRVSSGYLGAEFQETMVGLFSL